MAKFSAEIWVTLKPGVQDPVGRTILDNLPAMGIKGVTELSTGKYFKMTLDSMDKAKAEAVIKQVSDQLLANPNIETFRFQVDG